MSRDLLKRVIAECSDEGSRSNITPKLYGAIAEYLEMPEPDPVAWKDATYGNLHHVNYGDSMPLYAEPVDQTALIAELEKDNNITHENLAWYMKKYHEHLTIIAELEKSEAFLKDAVDRAIQDTEYYQEQLAALQAKREPLSDDEIRDCAESENLPYFENKEEFDAFARAIEAAHGIGVNHE